MAQATIDMRLTPGQPVLVGLPLPPWRRAAETLGLRVGIVGAGFADGARFLILAAEGEQALATFTPFGPAPPGGRRQYDLILSGPRLSRLRTRDGLRLRLLYLSGDGEGGDLTVDLTLVE